jgi:hypothetical protein
LFMNDGYLGLSGNLDAGPNEPTIAQPALFLPAQDGQQTYFQAQPQTPSQKVRSIRPEDLVRRPQSALPANPIARMGYLWRKEPAYRVLFIAIGIVLLSGFVCVGLVFGMFNAPTSQNAQTGGNSPQQSANNGVVKTGTPTPVATPTSAPTATPTPFPTPTPVPTQPPAPTPVPTQPPVMGPLTVQITSIPTTVQNNQTVSVGVTTNEPGSTVHLVIALNAFPYYTISQTQTTDAAGNATISWHVRVTTMRPGATVTAQVSVVAQDQRGMYVTSPQTTVQITTKG